ncbi:Rcs stress response system protein RcsF [Pseudomonadota bacterium]|uniref:Rcs stress response system protein RcsF n=1 Tax=unclassified Shewanella TaxID=196818 RepID=UPI0026E2B314|nr:MULTISPECIES: Rcs stress response system protein RcsF [unclassified Shewanella]MDO6620788.1 Rcs stress response system protein RcsF [Shewanella sp. 6_MG-2023]MDO6641809.1 Rcs stress response system protein RcsF [Shewanella sp. 5_MG-2023]MDO6680200.1 Rcs stress response system protein RcsF [Shewanella sp. 4_MG-2023]
MNVSRPVFSLAISSAILLSGCASEYTFNSNLDAKAIDDYFKPGNVVLYKENQRPKGSFEVLGLVEGESCQQTADGVPASIADARTDARKQAVELGANGLMIKKCLLTEQQVDSCYSQAICVGQAIKTATEQ